jgi:hypothetical protein
MFLPKTTFGTISNFHKKNRLNKNGIKNYPLQINKNIRVEIDFFNVDYGKKLCEGKFEFALFYIF